MKIIRNKYLTRIIGSDTELKLRTDKYDDIVGIANGVLPMTKFSIKDLIEINPDHLVILNDNRLTQLELYEFADMNAKLYISSIYNASGKFELENLIAERTTIKINQLLGRLLGNDETRFRLTTSKCRDYHLTPQGIIRDISIKDDFTELSSTKSVLVHLDNILDSDKTDKFCDSFRKMYAKAINDTIFYDKDGNIYSFPIPTNEELQELIINHLVFTKLSKDIPSTGQYNINTYKEIFLKLNTWKRYKSGLLTLIKDGQEILVDISTLITKEVYLQMKKYGKSILEVRRFAQIPY